MKIYTVYLLVAKDGRRYVGMTSLPLSVRCIPSRYVKCPSMRAAIREFGWDFFQKEVAVEGLSREEASVLEQEMIAAYGTVDPTKGFNTAYGGVRFKHNEISKQKISQSSTPRGDGFRKKKYLEQASYKHGVIQLDLGGNVISQFPSIREAAKSTNSDPSNIRKCANGALKTTNHFRWQFI